MFLKWNGLAFDFEKRGISILDHRIDHALCQLDAIITNWPRVTYRDIAKFLGQLNSMHPVLAGMATLRSKMVQTFVNIRHFHNYDWNAYISAESSRLFEKAFNELNFWKESLRLLNFRPFEIRAPSCCGWVDASNHAIGGVLVRLREVGDHGVPVTMDNWLLDGAGLLPRIRNCARLQVDVEERVPSIITAHDLDPAVVRDMYVVHRNLTVIEKVADSNERELLAAIELITACAELLRNSVFMLHFDNLNAAIICSKGSSKYRPHSLAF